jgi:hypothetical protein
MEANMNIHSSPFQQNMGIITVPAISSLVATTIIAGPNQLDILWTTPAEGIYGVRHYSRMGKPNNRIICACH